MSARRQTGTNRRRLCYGRAPVTTQTISSPGPEPRPDSGVRWALPALASAAAALALFDQRDPAWKKLAQPVVNHLLSQNSLVASAWVEALRPAAPYLMDALVRAYEERSSESAARRILATSILADYAAQRPEILEQLIVTPIRSWELIVGKLMPYVILGFFNTIEVLAVGHWWFGMPIRGDLGLIVGLSLIFLITGLGIGLFASTIANMEGRLMKTKIEEDRQPEIYNQVVPRELAAEMRKIMQSVNEGGTGTRAMAPAKAAGVNTGGKTGTAQKEVPEFDPKTGAPDRPSSWPGADHLGVGFRGGSWYTVVEAGQVANRRFGSGLTGYSDRSHDTGFRAVRTAPRKR